MNTILSFPKGILFVILLLTSVLQNSFGQTKPLKVGVIGLTHDHVHRILGRPERGDIKIVGIVESNRDVALRYTKQYNISMDIVYNNMDELIAKNKPEAVCAFGSIYDHLSVVQKFAPLGIHVMVEKPLAVSMEHANQMKALAEKHKIQLITNYETTWYATNHKAFQMISENAIGNVHKVVIHDGHKGPKEIGITNEFLEWLTDPVLNGGGAVVDFGCYGANLMTWISKGQRPKSVMALLQTIKPDVYPKVDDEATILIEYEKMQGIVQGSWNWPIARKDMEVYGKTGYIYTDNGSDMRFRLSEKTDEQKEKVENRKAPYDDEFSFFAGVINGDIVMKPYDLSSLENNLLVVEILEAAKESSKTGKRIELK